MLANLKKQWPCKYCGMVFTQKTHMYRHIRKSCKKIPTPKKNTTTTSVQMQFPLVQQQVIQQPVTHVQPQQVQKQLLQIQQQLSIIQQKVPQTQVVQQPVSYVQIQQQLLQIQQQLLQIQQLL